MYVSEVQPLNSVTFPEFTGERVYMEKFYKQDGLPSHLSRWQNTVDQMLDTVDTDQPIFIMIDQGIVKPNTSHRRPGPHIDGYWIEELQAHGGSSGGHRMPTSHHSVNHHRQPNVGGWQTGGSNWKTMGFIDPESIILASDVVGCKAYVGQWEGEIGEGGDLSHLNLEDLLNFSMESNVAYKGNVTFIHESVPLPVETQRTLVRLNLKGI